ncbi:MAG: hypothetical protein ACOYJA_01725 [Christensenellales bacterium]|jgi:outer membrane biosynthesis protein TonB
MKRFVKSVGVISALALAVLLPACSQQKTAEPNNTVVLEASVTPTPTASPTTTPTQKPTVSPTATPTASPTATAKPTQKPTATAKTSATAKPTQTAEPTATPDFTGDGYENAKTTEQQAAYDQANALQDKIVARNAELDTLMSQCDPESAEYQQYSEWKLFNEGRYSEAEDFYADAAAHPYDTARLNSIIRQLKAMENQIK